MQGELPSSWAEERMKLAGQGSRVCEFIHLSIQLHVSWPAAPTPFAASHWHFQGHLAGLGSGGLGETPSVVS